ncbi:MAG: hypothetical protein DSO09_05165 [Candidatus Methanomethylicota archaeon]|jgi:multiple sugar transport system permease protein|uniref:ABC transmembrane type-1 domain-containing protein n=1 Tax=Thermoproteota archaeon TaxID=2056631 RepID=A0A523BB73_9CREN|nr:MAG: hypothetical protein DSO09_05165 [Candidatus Verstraetearchaeota archaeon]
MVYKNKKIKVSDILANIFMILIIASVFIPMYFLIITSFKSFSEILRVPPTFFPEKLTLEGFLLAKEHGGDIFRSLANSLIMSIGVTITTLFFSSLAGYAFAVYRFKFKEALFIAVISKYLLPEIVLIIPWYWIMGRLKLIDNLFGVAVVNIIGAWSIFYIRNYITQIPPDYIEAARIDGANENRILFQIIWPMIRPALGVATTVNFLWSWNWFLWPLVLLQSKQNFTLPITVAFVRYIYGGGQESVPHYGAIAATTLVYILPVLLLYILVQKWFVEAFIATGIKR